MRFAYQTIIYGRTFGDTPAEKVKGLQRAVEVISAAGFTGIEIFQKPSDLGVTYSELCEILRGKLELVGLSDGSLTMRREYLGEDKKPYLYTDIFPRKESVETLEKGYRIAIHPHAFKPIHNIEEVVTLYRDSQLKKYFQNGQLQLLPDTAHAHIVGDKVVDLCQRFEKQLAGVHLKGWYSAYGSMSHRYSKGFCGIWEGYAPVKPLLEELKARNSRYRNPWCVVEQDYGPDSPEDSIFRAAATLTQWGYLTVDANQIPKLDKKPERIIDPELAVFELKLRRAMISVPTSNLDVCYRHGVDAVRKSMDFNAAILLGLQTVDVIHDEKAGYTTQDKGTPISISTVGDNSEDCVLCCTAWIDAEEIIEGPLECPEDDSKLPEWERQLWTDSKFKWRVKIDNPYNLNQGRYSLYLYGKPDIKLLREKLKVAAGCLARHLDHRLDQVCLLAGSRIEVEAAKAQGLEDFVEVLRSTVAEVSSCEAAVLFSLDSSGTRLLPIGNGENLKWKDRVGPANQIYEIVKDDKARTVQVFRKRLPRITEEISDQRSGISYMELNSSAAGSKVFGAAVPMVNAIGKASGVIRCANRKQGKQFRFFHGDDIAVIDATLQTALPRINALRAEWERRNRLRKVTHELKRPLFVINAAIQSIEAEWNQRKRQFISQGFADLPFPWFEDVKSWNKIMQFQVKNPDYLSVQNRNIHLDIKSVDLVGAVVAPMVRWMAIEVHRRDLPVKQKNGQFSINHGNSKEIDPLFVDKNMFQQIFFNLLDNAIKYARKDAPTEFKIEILYEAVDGKIVIKFRDWGIGVAGIENQTALFEDGVRAPNAYLHDLNGTGYGLWVVRRLVELHQGTITITGASQPTEFTMEFLASIKNENWYNPQNKPRTAG